MGQAASSTGQLQALTPRGPGCGGALVHGGAFTPVLKGWGASAGVTRPSHLGKAEGQRYPRDPVSQTAFWSLPGDKGAQGACEAQVHVAVRAAEPVSASPLHH